MSKKLKKLITILILFVMMFQVMLPTCFATPRDDFEATKYKGKDGEYYYKYDGKEYKEFIPIVTGWFSGPFDGEFIWEKSWLKNIFYFDDKGNKVEVTVNKENEEYYGENVFVYLVKDKVYFVPKNASLNIFNDLGGASLEVFEAMIADFIFSIASGFHYLVGAALGEALTIDDIVFNNYEEINISFFENDATGYSKLIYGDGNVKGLNSIIPSWYSFFMKIAFIGYMAILVYMGIKILMTSTAEKKADYKKLFMDWIVGLTILLLFPYAMKYMIKANDSIVETIEANKGFSDATSGVMANENMNYDKDPTVVDEEIQWETGTDYMSTIATAAEQLRKISLSLAFMIMTWQLITLIFHYYKRLFMIAFLIVIFPLVAFTYAIDKIADSKSQAFNTWLKEFMLNVFVQSFHAVVYVFVCSTVYSAAGMGGSIGFDYILIIVGVTFLFTGEEIIRKIFGQDSAAGTMGSLAETAAASFAKFAIVKTIATEVSSRTFGEKSIPRKALSGAFRLKAMDARISAFDSVATNKEDYNKGARLEHYNDSPDDRASDEQKEFFFKNREKYFNAAAVFNNPNSHSYEEKARALETLKELAKMKPEKDDIGLKKLKAGVFKDLKATEGQILSMAQLDSDVQHMMNAGMERIDIEREVTARLGVIFSNETKEQIQERTKIYFTGMYLKGASNTVSINPIKQEVEAILEESENIKNSIVFADHDLTEDEKEIVRIELEEETNEIYDYYNEGASNNPPVSREYAKNIAILVGRGSGVYTESEILAAADYVRNHSNDNEAITRLMEEDFGMDMDMFMHTLARKITDEPEDNTRGNDYKAARRVARDVVRDYESNARDGYFDDEISVHQIIKNQSNHDEIDRIMEEVFEKRKQAMEEATEEVAKEYLVDNDISITEGSQDTEVRTVEGYTYEEWLAMRVHEQGKILKDIASINKAEASNDSLGWLDYMIKDFLEKKEEERTGISQRLDERDTKLGKAWSDIKAFFSDAVSGETLKKNIDDKKDKRDEIDEAHFLGDIGDRK